MAGVAPSFRVEGMALGALGWLWWRAFCALGRPGRGASLHGRGTW